MTQPAVEYFKNNFQLVGNETIKATNFSGGQLLEIYDADYLFCDSYLLVVAGSTWSTALRTILYFLALGWCFLGVAIIADIFMQAIEVITSKEQVIKRGNSEIKVKVWNPTIANLSLMALGSSAPEILLSVIETVGTLGEIPGELGPSTIVGSAAFNLLFISAVCVIAPGEDTRKIEEVNVFATTAFFSVWAYIWLFICLSIWTPSIISLTEAILTFLQFFLLLIIAYCFDVKVCSKGGNRKQNRNIINKDHIANAYKKGQNVLNVVAALEDGQGSNNMAMYRIDAKRRMFGGKRLLHDKGPASNKVVPLETGAPVYDRDTPAILNFEQDVKSCMENQGNIEILLERSGNISCRVEVDIETIEGTAKHEKDFKSLKQTLEFLPGEKEKIVSIVIIDNDTPEPNRRFTLHLRGYKGDGGVKVELGKSHIVEVTIVDDDVPGSLMFAEEETVVQEHEGHALVKVIREEGCHGEVKVNYKTKEGSATPGEDYEHVEGELVFAHKQIEAIIEVPILNDFRYEENEEFYVILSNPTTCTLGSRAKTEIVIESDEEIKNVLDKAFVIVAKKKENVTSFFSRNWGQQFVDAMDVTGGADTEDPEIPTMAYVLHFMSFFWKVLFATCPPPSIGGGWPCFCVALSFIGALTAVIGELANLFGCSVGLLTPVTAITFVALGTSLPDTFASKQAAEQAPSADSAIGNITGSNGVNVFLGLGLPWLIGAIYYGSDPYVVPEGALRGGVIVFTACATTCLLTLTIRRRLVGGELGGAGAKPTAVFFVFLWMTYVLLSSLQTYGYFQI